MFVLEESIGKQYRLFLMNTVKLLRTGFSGRFLRLFCFWRLIAARPARRISPRNLRCGIARHVLNRVKLKNRQQASSARAITPRNRRKRSQDHSAPGRGTLPFRRRNPWRSTASRPACPSRRKSSASLTSRDEVVSYLTKHMNDEDTKRLRRSELVLKKVRPAARAISIWKPSWSRFCAKKWPATTIPRRKP